MQLSATVPAAKVGQLWPPTAPARTDSAAYLPRFAGLAGALLAALPAFPAPFTLPDQASNEWAVTGARTATGAPLLAGDPHLTYGKPGIWYLARIDTPHEVLAGAFAPGVPFLVIGRNSRIAWTFTTTGADTEDLFVETPTPDGRSYLTPDGPRPFTERREVIHVRGGADVNLTVRGTRHGPVISDVLPKAGPVLAVQMAALAPGDTAAMGLLALNDAPDVAAAGRAAPEITAPVQNLLVADTAHIGLFVTGRVPIRRAGDGENPVSGADGAHDWIGWASGDQLPHALDPPSGRLVNANEPINLPNSTVFMGRDGFGDWRATRIRQMLDALPHATAADFSRMQTDVVSVYAQQLMPTLLRVPATGLAARALGLLRGWNGAVTMDAPQPLILDAWLPRFRAAVIARAKIPAGTGFHYLEFVQFVLSPQGAAWCGGDCLPLLSQTLAQSVAGLTQRFGPDPARWRWGDAHRAIFEHPILGRLPLIGSLTTSSIEAPGDDTTVDRGGTSQQPGSFDDIHGPAFRGVYDLSDLDRSRFVVAPGQSGNPLSGHAADFVTRWRNGATIALRTLDVPPTATIRLLP